MSRPFRFKQFTIQQSRAPMKVGTDGVLLGAWAGVEAPKNILDIGTGTGLIAIMLAQRFPDARITAIEPNEEAAFDAKLNFQNSPFAERLNLIHTNLTNFQSGYQFDLIVSNPPFFSNSLISENKGRTEARHNFSLSPLVLAQATEMLINEGKMAVIYPVETYLTFNREMKKRGFSEERRTEIKPTPNKPVHRVLAEFGKTSRPSIDSELVIEKYGRHQYGEGYIRLTRDFYLFAEKEK